MKNTDRYRKTVEIIFEIFLVLIMTALFIYVFIYKYHDTIFYSNRGNYVLAILYAIEFSIFSLLYGGDKLEASSILDLSISNFISLVITNFLMYLVISLIAFRIINVIWFIILTVIQLLFVVIVSFLFSKFFNNKFSPRKCLFIYTNSDNGIYRKINKYRSNNFNIYKSINTKSYDHEVESELKQADCVMIVNENEELKSNIIKKCFEANKSVYLVPSIYDVLLNNGKVAHWIDTPVLKINHLGPQQLEKVLKRTMDIVVSLIVILVIWPIMLIVAIAIKLEDNGPIIYSQTRLTQYEKEFRIYKFRSMRVDAEKNGKAQFAKENDDRITKVGKVIRSLRFDELPQVINILKGDMSLVGPRPERPEIAKGIYEKFPEFRYRLKVKAGLTGYAQVYGKYNTSLRDKLLLDLLYIENYSILTDIKLILMTVKIIFSKDSTEGVDENTDLNL